MDKPFAVPDQGLSLADGAIGQPAFEGPLADAEIIGRLA
jgi:hypothetical protein